MKSQKNTNSHDRRSLWQVFLWLIGYYKDLEFTAHPPENFIFPHYLASLVGENTITWVGHSTFLLQCNGKTLLTDPVWADRASPFSWIGPKRQSDPAIKFDDLPAVDYVLISHNHYDHLDEKTCLALHKRNPMLQFIVPLGLKAWFDKRGIKKVHELEWWQDVRLDDILITAMPCQHFSGRGVFDRDKTLWCGYMVQAQTNCLYYVGDTGYSDTLFKTIQGKFPNIDVSLIPIGAYAPRQFMHPVHVNPYEAVQIHQDLQSKLSIGCHYGTFLLADEPLNRPPYDLALALGLTTCSTPFGLLKPGQPFFWK